MCAKAQKSQISVTHMVKVWEPHGELVKGNSLQLNLNMIEALFTKLAYLGSFLSPVGVQDLCIHHRCGGKIKRGRQLLIALSQVKGWEKPADK